MTLRLGDRGSHIVALQQSLSRLGYTLKSDGVFGQKTLAAVQAYTHDRTQRTAPDWLLASIHAEAATRTAETVQPDLAPITRGIRTIGAWCGTTSLANPVRDVAVAAAHGITRLDIVVNDHSNWRTPRDFTLRSPSQVEQLCRIARDAGIEVHLMTWIMPHQRYIEGAAAKLRPLCERLGIRSLQFDAEEPWTQAKQAMTHRAAAKLIAQAFANFPCKLGANAIGHTPVDKFAPLAEVVDYLVPQAYATSTSKIPPGKAPGRFYERYRKYFGKMKVIAMGLAAYRQSGIRGHTPASAIAAALDSTAALSDVDTVIYWSLDAIRRAPAVAKAIAGSRLDGPIVAR